MSRIDPSKPVAQACPTDPDSTATFPDTLLISHVAALRRTLSHSVANSSEEYFVVEYRYAEKTHACVARFWLFPKLSPSLSHHSQAHVDPVLM